MINTNHVLDVTDAYFESGVLLRSIGPLMILCIDDAYNLYYTSLTVNANCKIFWMKDQMKSTSFTSFCDSLSILC